MDIKQKSLKRLILNLAIIALLSATILLLFFYVFLPSRTNHGETMTVPKLTGLHLDEIEDYVGNHLRYEVSDSGFSDVYEPLTVLEQYPKPGHKVKEKRMIYLTVNRTVPPTVPIPDLIDHSLINADAVLKSNELKRGEISFKPSPYLNLVLEMQHEGEKLEPKSRLPKGSVIDLVVGDGYGRNQKFGAPDLRNLSLDEAKFNIVGSSLNMGVIILKEDTTGHTPIVVKQKPDPDVEVRMGETIDLWVATEPDSSIYEAEEIMDIDEEEN